VGSPFVHHPTPPHPPTTAPHHHKQVIADFANGEISQAASLFDTETTLDTYMDKSFYKVGGLCRVCMCVHACVIR